MEQIIIRVAAVITALGIILGVWPKLCKWYKARKAKKAEFETKVLESLGAINEHMNTMSDDIVMMLRDRLKSAHGDHMRRGWIPPGEKDTLLELYDSYTKKGYNSLIDSYADDIKELPEEPKKSRTADACGIRKV